MGVPYPGAGRPVSVGPFSDTIADGATFSSEIVQSRGANISVAAKVTHAATLHIKQYGDADGNFLIQDTTQALVANTVATKTVADGKPFLFLQITIVNSAGATMDIDELVVIQ